MGYKFCPTCGEEVEEQRIRGETLDETRARFRREFPELAALPKLEEILGTERAQKWATNAFRIFAVGAGHPHDEIRKALKSE